MTKSTAALAALLVAGLASTACDSNDHGSDDNGDASSGESGDSSAGSAADDGADTGVDESTSDTGESACVTNYDCADDEVCFYEGCAPADDFVYDVTIISFEPASCADGFGGSEIYFKYFESDTLISTSSQTSCPASWPNDTVEYDSTEGFEVEFWEADVVYDDNLANFCFNDYCGPIPAEYLHDGSWSGMAGDFYVDIEIALTE